MACRYTYQGKTYEAWEFDDVLRAMNPIEASKYMTGVEPVKEPVDLSGKQIMWIRHNTRTDDKLGSGLFLEEVQSQRGSEGRTKGFTPYEAKKWYVKHKGKWGSTVGQGFNTKAEAEDELNITWWNKKDDMEIVYSKDANISSDKVTTTPPAPFITDNNNKATNAYISLLLKKAISQAIDNGQNFVAWTTGSQQADRYDLSKQVDKIQWIEHKSELITWKDGRNISSVNDVNKDNLSNYVGKEIAELLINTPKGMAGIRTVSGDNLKVGGAWTQAMYGDEQGLNQQGKPSLITQSAGEIARKFGGKISTVNLSTGTQPALIITPEMRQKVINEGMPLFSKTQSNIDAMQSESAPVFKVVNTGDIVDGRIVREEVPNMSSIDSSLDDYTILDGIREVPISYFDKSYIKSINYKNLDPRTKRLADQIKESGEINPLIVAFDSEGLYVIEGGHRFDALIAINAQEIPAVVVIDESNPPDNNIRYSKSSLQSKITDAIDENWMDIVNEMKRQGVIEIRC